MKSVKKCTQKKQNICDEQRKWKSCSYRIFPVQNVCVDTLLILVVFLVLGQQHIPQDRHHHLRRRQQHHHHHRHLGHDADQVRWYRDSNLLAETDTVSFQTQQNRHTLILRWDHHCIHCHHHVIHCHHHGHHCDHHGHHGDHHSDDGDYKCRATQCKEGTQSFSVSRRPPVPIFASNILKHILHHTLFLMIH